jgi:sulfur relay (sulfurtransferase) complex TusBCD TusD component (DsrE family)
LKNYLIIQSQDPFSQGSAEQHYALAQSLASAGNSVRMLLVQHGVIVARKDTQNSAFEQLLKDDVKVYADSYALAEREIDAAELRPGISVAAMELVATALLAGDKVIWH